MHIVIVDFVVGKAFVAPFLALLVANARTSREKEAGCRQFDVCCAPDDLRRFFLYEVYDDKAAFDAHLHAPHFAQFNEAAAAWIESKMVRVLVRIEPA